MYANVPCINLSQTGQQLLYLPQRDQKLSWARWLAICWNGLPVHKESPVPKGPLDSDTTAVKPIFFYHMQLTWRSHSLAASEAVWSSNKPPSNLFTGQSFTMCDTDWEQSNSQTHDLLIISSTSLLLCNPSTVMDLLQLWPQLKLCKSKQGQQKRRSSRLITVVTYKEEMSGGADARHCARYINCSMMLCVIDARLRWELNCSTWALLQPL